MGDLVFQSFSGTSRPSSFGYYDLDAHFQVDADKVVYYIQREMGAPVLDSELDLRQIWSAFEQATMEYSTTINTYHARNVMLDLLGRPSGSLSGSEGALPLMNTSEFSRKILIQYAAEFGANSPYPWFTASINLVPNQQTYNLLTPITGILSGTSMENQLVQIRKVHHYEPSAAYRFFDTTSVTNFMANNLNFASYSPETIFYMLPIWEDVLRGTQLQLSQRVRRSNYSFDIQGYQLRVYPVPTRSQKLWFEWSPSKDPLNPQINGINLNQTKGVTSNLSNIAFGHIGYSNINSMGRNWIFRMTKAMCKEILGNIRSYYSKIPIPDSDITLNGPELINQAKSEMENLRQELREILEQMTYKNLMTERVELEELAKKSFQNVPLMIYVSR
jgi:hypothetical protein